MTTYHSTMTFTQKPRPGGKDEPEDLRQLRKTHGSSLATLKELFADWTEEDLLYAIQDAGGDLEVAILRISDGKFLFPSHLQQPPPSPISIWLVGWRSSALPCGSFLILFWCGEAKEEKRRQYPLDRMVAPLICLT